MLTVLEGMIIHSIDKRHSGSGGIDPPLGLQVASQGCQEPDRLVQRGVSGLLVLAGGHFNVTHIINISLQSRSLVDSHNLARRQGERWTPHLTLNSKKKMCLFAPTSLHLASKPRPPSSISTRALPPARVSAVAPQEPRRRDPSQPSNITGLT